MKKLLPLLLFAIILTACNTNPSSVNLVAGSQTIKVPDTTGLAAYNLLKAQTELTNPIAATQQAVPKTRVRTIVKRIPVPSANSSYSMTSESVATAKAKKVWSKSAKGAVIGGVGGAAIGAIINRRNPVIGGIIGGILGAAGGYGVGRRMDKKDGRIQ